MNEERDEKKPYTVKLNDAEVEAIRRITHVDAVAVAVVAIVRQRIEDERLPKGG